MIFEIADQLQKTGSSFFIITLIEVRGSAPQDEGAKCIVSKNGLEFGTVGGGKVEAYAISYAQNLLSNNNYQKPQTKTWNLQTEIGMTCGGEVTFLFEHFPAHAWPIVIFGAGHVSQALTRALAPLKCQITCIDPRSEWLDKLDSSQKNLQKVLSEEPKTIVNSLDPNSFFLCMTKGHSFDVPVLFQIFNSFPQARYVGVIGSDVKGKKIKAELKDLGASDEFINKLIVPIGLPIGNNEPSEIAISIAAQLLQIRDL
jgi:xanthine dehydrogenase accessory factor